ncbi:ATP-binding protein [Listeria monocytogenes]|nr:ATP-binding protein [Listeria monocytogenes]
MHTSERTTTPAGNFEKVEIPAVRFVENRLCETCGKEYPVYERNGEQTGICIHCENKAVQNEMQRRHDETEKRRIFRIMEENSYVPDEIKKESFDSFKAEDPTEIAALQMCKEYVEAFPENKKLVLQGNTGTGKSHLAYATSRELLKKGYLVLFVTVPEMLDSVRRTFDRNSEITKQELISWYLKADLLVLDDLGVEKINEKNQGFVSEIMYDITNGRVDKPLIITTNLKSKGIAARYGGVEGQRIVSRISKNSTVIELKGRDRRIASW